LCLKNKIIDMFENIYSLGLQRTTKQAWGFYIGHLIVIFFLGVLAGLIQSLFEPVPISFSAGFKQGLTSGIGPIVAIVYLAAVIFIMLKQKHLLNNFRYIILGLLTLILAGLGGGIFGLIIPAVVSAKPSATIPPPPSQISI
jgi:hypothetical protein